MTADPTLDQPATTVAHPIGRDGVLAISLPDGDVQVRVTDGDTASVRSADGSPLDGFDIDRGGGSLSVRWRGGSWFNRGHAPDLQIETPVGASLVIEAASADIDVSGVRGDQRLRTASGDISVRDAGGTVAVEAMSGDVRIQGSAALRLEARTVSGDFGLQAGLIGSMRVATTSGDLHIAGRFDGPGPFSVESVSGDTVLAPAGGVRVDVRTIAGDVRSERPAKAEGGRGRRTFVVEEGGPTIDVRSTSGDVAIVRATVLPMPPALAPIPAPPAAAPPAPPTPPTSVEPPIAPTEPEAPTERTPIADAPAVVVAADDARLEILQALERDEIDLDEARRRLEALDGAGEADHA